MNAVRRIAAPAEAPAERDAGSDAYAAWCSECEPVLRLILLGTPAQVERWTLAKAQARRVAVDHADGLDPVSMRRAMLRPPTDDDRRHAEGMAERIAATRDWLLGAVPGTPAQVLARLVRGGLPEAMVAMADRRTLPPPSREADRHARYAGLSERADGRAERMRAPPSPDEDRF